MSARLSPRGARRAHWAGPSFGEYTYRSVYCAATPGTVNSRRRGASSDVSDPPAASIELARALAREGQRSTPENASRGVSRESQRRRQDRSRPSASAARTVGGNAGRASRCSCSSDRGPVAQGSDPVSQVTRLPRSTRLFLAGNTVSMVGNGLVIPYLLIYLHQVRGIDLPVVGALLARASIAG